MTVAAKEQMSITPESDEELVELVQGGAYSYYRLLVERYSAPIFSMIMRQVRDRELADELTQETFVRAYKGIGKFRGDSKFSTWLIRIALNITNSYFASRRYKNAQKTTSLEDWMGGVSENNPERTHQQKELLKSFGDALGQLTPQFREVIVLCGIEGRSYKEASESLGVPIGTVRSRLNSARLKLRAIMNGEE